MIRRIFYLIGFMGSGKSTLGKHMAENSGMDFIELDACVEKKCGKSIAEIFSDSGEGFFREAEKKTLRETALLYHAIIATGGGTPCFYDNMEFMKKAGTVIFLEQDVKELVRRLTHENEKRPLLQNLSDITLEEKITKLSAERRPYYQQAHIILSPHQQQQILENRISFQSLLS